MAKIPIAIQKAGCVYNASQKNLHDSQVSIALPILSRPILGLSYAEIPSSVLHDKNVNTPFIRSILHNASISSAPILALKYPMAIPRCGDVKALIHPSWWLRSTYMAEALGVSSAVITLASTAYKSCQTLHNAVDGYRSAHSQFLALSADLETFYLVLGTLQAALQEEAASAAAVEAVMSEGLSKALEESMDVFKRISAVVQAFGASRTAERSSLAGTLQKAKWVLNEKAIANLRKDLLDCKMSLNIAICVTNE
ncbi:uncharacterized protein KY384_008521 [Bacidia gigantensis]|uniref:uncharacterized protein n=1 Tax=Bacidia gigantensis TaxID=2732470 RepID=UPI001D051746|nr:uncharacterized protein KY384_008521 [Bacidia gigantensis]KAG8527092.1 hypothetical protein KY384_008521 [Bacidia gigantensis]